MTSSDPDFEKALDHFTTPAPRAGLRDDIVAAAKNRATPSPELWQRAPRDRRGGWLRGHRAFAISMAATIMSATTAAAAGGWLGEASTRLPVIAQLATVMPEAVKAPTDRKAEAGRQPLAVRKASVAAEVAVAPPTNTPVVLPPRVEKKVERVEARLDARDARRAARGLPVNTEKERALLAKFKAADTREERKAVLQEARALRQKRRAEHQALPICAEAQAGNPYANGCRRHMSPERRAEIMQRLCARIDENGRKPPRCRPDMRGRPESLADPTPQ